MKWGLHVTGESPALPPCAANTEGFGYTTRDVSTPAASGWLDLRVL